MLHNGKQENPERKDFLIHKIENDILAKSTVPTSPGDPLFSKWGPDGDPIFSEMGT